MNKIKQQVDLREVLAIQRAKIGTTILIAIDGRGGSGKSMLATWLSERLNAQVIHTDDFASWDNPINWWPILIERVFEPIKNGATTLSYPRSKWWDNHFPEAAVNQPVTCVMIVEGVSSSRREFRDYINLSIFVDTPKAICLHRGIKRDTATGRTRRELEMIWSEWSNDEDEYMRRDHPQEHADIVVNGTVPFEEQLLA